MRSWRPPAPVADRCCRLTADLGLAVAGLDLRRTPDGTWYCFEVNPSPGFTYYEYMTGAPLTEAVASLLRRPAIGRLTPERTSSPAPATSESGWS
jgi:hypothetical protein